METKKEDKKEQKPENEIYENMIFDIGQTLIKSFHTSNLKKDGNTEISKALDEVTKNKFPKLQQLYNEKCKQIEEKNKSIEELTDTLKRLQAEFENYKKRSDKDKAEFAKYAHAEVVANILPIVDSFEMAIKNTDDKEKFVQGIKLIYAQFVSTLESLGLRPIKSEGGQFDPYRHEVLLKEKSDKPEGTILEELQKGYMFHDKVLRFSKVKVSGK